MVLQKQGHLQKGSELALLPEKAQPLVCNKMLNMYYQSVVVSTIFYAVMCSVGGITSKDANRQKKLIKKAGSVPESSLVTLEEEREDRMMAKLLAILGNATYHLHNMLKSTFSNRPI